MLQHLPLCVKSRTFWLVPSPAARGLTPYCPLFLNANKFCLTLSASVNYAFKVHIAFIPWFLAFFAWLLSKLDFIFFNIRFWTWFWAFHRPPLPLQTLHCLSLLDCNPSLCLHCTFLLTFLNLIAFLLSYLPSLLWLNDILHWRYIRAGPTYVHLPSSISLSLVLPVSHLVSFSLTNLYFFPLIVRHSGCCSNPVFCFGCLNMGAIIWPLEVPLVLVDGCSSSETCTGISPS